LAIHLRTGLFAVLFIAGICPAQAASPGIPGFFNPVTRVFVPLQLPSPAATAATATGTIKVEFSIAIKSVLPSGDKISCGISAGLYNTTTGAGFSESAASNATVTGSTATCTAIIPYSWPGVTSASSISLDFTLSDSLGARFSNDSIATFKVPANGTTTTYKVSPVF